MSDPGAEPPRSGLRVGVVLGVPVYVSASWLIFAVVVAVAYAQVVQGNLPDLGTGPAYAVAAVFVVLLLLSVFLHELGHAVVSQRFGIRVRAMTLWMLGGYTEMERESPSPGVEVAVAAAGPVVSLLVGGLGAAAAAVLEPGTIGRELAVQVALSNLVVGVFNLLPGLPLDGGRLLEAGVWQVTRRRHLGTVAAGWAGRLLAAGVVVLALFPVLTGTGGLDAGLLFTLLVAVFLWGGASQALRSGRLRGRFDRLVVGALVRPALPVAGDVPLAEALRRAAEVGRRALVVVDGAGRPIGVVVDEAVAAVPVERRPWVSVQSVARTVPPGQALPADLAGEDLVRAVQARPAGEYLVVDAAGAVTGVLTAADVARTLEARRR